MPEVGTGSTNDLRRQANELLDAGDFSRAREVMEQIFDGRDASIANNLGYVCSIWGTRDYNLEKAIEYYKISANTGDAHGQVALGWIFRELGDVDQAIRWYQAASESGSGEGSYNLYRLLRDRGDLVQARQALDLAEMRGHPIAEHTAAMERMLGSRGLTQIPTGILQYIKNAPVYMKHMKRMIEAPGNRRKKVLGHN
jgi:TPR repeat protein